jgi:RNA polymerase sigma-70 factor (ECF subfamily)
MKNILAAINNAYPRAAEIDWQNVYSASLPKIFHYFCYKVGNPSVAEDLTAHTFEKAWKSRNNFKKDLGEVQHWLLGIAQHVAIDHFRKRSREISFDDLPERSLTSSFEEDVQRQLDFQTIMVLLEQHTDRERELIAMKYGAELTNREIARLTGLSESNVGTILNRVINKLRIGWEESHER